MIIEGSFTLLAAIMHRCHINWAKEYIIDKEKFDAAPKGNNLRKENYQKNKLRRLKLYVHNAGWLKWVVLILGIFAFVRSFFPVA